jgi:hypothetical protein
MPSTWLLPCAVRPWRQTLDWLVRHGVMFVLVFSVGVALLGAWCWRGIREDVQIARGRSSGPWPVLNTPGRRVVGMVIAVAGLLVFMHVASEMPGQRRLYNRLLHYGIGTRATVVDIDGKIRGHIHAHRLTIRYSVNGQTIQRQIPIESGDRDIPYLRRGSVVKITYDRREPNVSRLSEDAEDGGLFFSFFLCFISIAATVCGGYIARRTARGIPATRQVSEKQAPAG